MDFSDEDFADDVIPEGSEAERNGSRARLPRTRNSMQFNRSYSLNRLSPTGETETPTTPDLIQNRSSSTSDEEVVFRGRAQNSRAFNVEGLSEALSGLSVFKDEAETEKSRDDVSSHTLDVSSISQEEQQPFNDSGNVRSLTATALRPSPSQVSAAERDNPYPDIDLNEGWNRAGIQGVKQYFAGKPSMSNDKIVQDFAGYSLKAQQLLLPVCSDLEKLFTFIFRRNGPANKPFHTCRSLVLSRHPALQPIMNSSLSTCSRPRSFNLCDLAGYDPGRQVMLFDLPPETSSQYCKSSSQLVPSRGVLKRECKRNAHQAQLAKDTWLSEKRQRLHLGGRLRFPQGPSLEARAGRSGLVVSDGWRRRMRRRAVNAGRWTDGTMRQDRLWAEYHWVLDGGVEEDPLEQKRATFGQVSRI